MATGQVHEFLAAREELMNRASGGTADARALADLADGTVAALAGAVPARSGARFALFALGGYGAHRLLPHSDLDLLVISRGGTAEIEPIVRSLLYPLWDAGLTVGYQVRTPRQQVRALREDVETLTGFLSARFLFGDEALADETLTTAFARIARDAARHVRAIGSRERNGSPYLLEPDLKEGAGGQRDLDELVWRAAIASASPAYDLWPLAARGALTIEQADTLIGAQDAITAARWRLHAGAGRGRNVMALDGAGIDEAVADRAQRALETVHHVLLEVRSRSQGDVMSLDAPLTGSELRTLAARGEAALPDLEAAARLGRFDHAVPGFRALMTLRRPALSHRLTVGAHCLETLALVGSPDIDGRPTALDPVARDALIVAALVHDLGKREPGAGHAERGARQTPAVADRLGFDAATGEAAATLVREHLLLGDLATRADLTDEDVILAAAARIGEAPLVAPLFLLTAADMRATGPDVWTPWRATLVAELASKLEAALAPGADGTGIVAAAEATRERARTDASSVGAPHALLSFIDDAPLRYLARRTPDEIVRDARLAVTLRGPVRGGESATSVGPGPVDGTWLLDVVTRDRPGLIATISGVLALCGLDVLSAEAFTDRNGIAVDRFAVTSATLAPVEHATWVAVDRNLAAALGRRLDLETRLAERARHYTLRGPRVRVRVRIGTRSAFSTPVEVRTSDRVGLLHDLARAIATAGFDIRRAAATTTGGVALDTFELTDAQGVPPHAAELRRGLLPALEAAAEGVSQT